MPGERKPLVLPKRLRVSPSHQRAKVQEKKSAARFGGETTPGSGNQRIKGDARTYGLVRVECKTTKHKSFSVTTAMIEGIEDATVGTDEVPVIEVELELGKNKVYVVPAWAMEMLLNVT